MGAHHNRIRACSVISRNDISDSIGRRPKPRLRNSSAKCSRPAPFAKGRRRNSRQTNLIGLDFRFVIRDETKCPLDASILQNSLDERLALSDFERHRMGFHRRTRCQTADDLILTRPTQH